MTFKRKLHKTFSVLALFSFVSGQILPPATAAQPSSVLNLPMPGAMVGVSPKYVPIAIKGIKIFPDNPFRFDFLLDTGNSNLNEERLNEETKILIKYFLTALTIPDQDQWVNLSPVEHDRIVPTEFGITEMGRDLLAQDYLLKQLTASLIYPEHELGKKFWENVYRKAYEKYGDADIPMSTFNKVWIMPDHATVYQNGNTAVITESRLKVLLEEDYLALSKGVPDSQNPRDPGTLGAREPRDYNAFGSQIVREIVLPEIEREVNEGKNFARLRQVYRSMIMAAWFKRKLKDGIINKMYVGQKKVAGVDVADKEIKEKVYQQYLEAYKKGVYNYIKEDIDPRTQAVVPRKYFSGGIKTGVEVDRTTEMITVNPDQLASAAGDVTGDSLTASIGLNPVDTTGKGVEILNRPEISLSIDVKRRLDDNVGFLMDIVKTVQNSVSQRGGGIYQYHLYLNNTEPSRQTLPEKFRERFQEIEDPQEIRYFARALSREWKNNGFDKDFGSVFEYVAQTLSDYVGTPSQIKKMYAWMYTFLEESEPLERVYALRLLIVSFINHLRRNGIHPENENNQFGLSDEKFPLDMELLLGNPRDLQGEQIVQRYILGLLELQKTSQWTEVIPGLDGQPNKLGLTNEDMLLWGLALAVDPTIYYEGIDEESRPYPTKDIGVYLSKYFGEEVNEQNAGVKFLQRAFSHESLKDKRPQIEALLIKALGISDQQWADKGQRSPFRFAFNLDYLGSIFTGTSIWDESLRILGNPMLMLGFDFSYWSGPSKSMLQPSSNSTRHLILRKQGEQGLRPLYVSAFTSPEMAALFPNFAAGLTGRGMTKQPAIGPLEFSLFNENTPYLEYDPTNKEARRKVLEDRGAQIAEKVFEAFDANNSLQRQLSSLVLTILNHSIINAVDAIVQRLDNIADPVERQEIIRKAKITFNYAENSETGEYEFKLSDTGVGIGKELLESWGRGEFYSTKTDNPEEAFLRYAGGSGETIGALLSTAKDFNVAVTVTTKRADSVAVRFTQEADGQISISDVPGVRQEEGSDFIFKGKNELKRGPTSAGGALKDLSVFDPDKPAPAPSDVTLTVWKRLASNATVQLLSIADQEIKAKIIEVDAQQMPEGLTAYHFIDEGNALVIVLSSDIFDAKVRNEVIFHEAMEANWSELLKPQGNQPLSAEEVAKVKRDVHILAWAEQVASFGKENLTPLHQQQLALLSPGQKVALKAEQNRAYQDGLVKQYFPLDRYEEYLKYKQRFQDALTKSASPVSVDPALIPKVGALLTEESLQALAQFNLLNAEGLKRMLPVGKVVTADFLDGVAMLTRLLNVEPGPNFGIRGGALARTDKDIHSALSDMLNVYSGNLNFEDRERLAATLARMKEGSLQLLNIMGVINDNEFELLKSKDATGLKNLNAESKQEFLDRLAALVGSYDGLAKTNKTGLMIRLVPLKVIDLLMEYFGSSKATVQTVIRGHPDFPAWLVAAELKVQSIQKLVSGPRNAWIVVQAQGLEKTDEWIEKARVIVDKIQPLVGSRGQAWHIIIIQGIDKAGDWAEKAHVKVLAIQDKVGGSSNAWQIVVRQGIDKVDAWVEKAQKKVSAILPVVGSETNAWLILIGLGTDGTDAWIKSRKQQAEELQRSGQTVTTAWKNIIRTSLFSDEDGGLENGGVTGDTATAGGQLVTVRVAAAPLNGKPQPVIPSGESPELLSKRKYLWVAMSRMRLASGEIITLLEHDHSRYGGAKPSSEQRPGIIVFPGDYFLQGIDYVENEFRLLLPFVNSQEYVDVKSGETFTIKSEFYPETGFTYHEIFRKDGTEAGQFTDPRMGNNSQDPAAAIMRRYDRILAARAGQGETDLVGAVRMDYRRVMTREEIDRRIDEIPKEFRNWFGFGNPENDGEVPVKFQAGASESEWLAFSNVTGFTIGKLGMGDALYVASLNGDQIEINVFWIKYDSAGSGRPKPVLDAALVDKKDLPLNVSKEFNIELDEDMKWSAARTLLAGASLQAGFGMGYYERMEDELILAMDLIGEPDTVPYYELVNWPENRIELRKDITLIREEIWSVKWGQYITALINNDLETAKRVLEEARNGPIKAPLGHNVEEIGAALTDPVIREKLIRMFERQQDAQDGFFDEAEGQEEIDTPYYSGAMLKTDLEIMGLKEGATREELDQAKRKLNRKYHPDLVETKEEDLLEQGRKLQEINDAYARLKKHPWFSENNQNNSQDEINPGDQASDGERNNGLPGGALKQIGILGDRQSLQVPAAILNRWNDLAKDELPQSFEIAGEKFTAKVVRAADMPQGLFAYNFRDGQNQLVIVLSDELASQEERNEAVYHEFREDYWLANGQNDWAAHVLASAEESIAFGQNGTKISPYHTKQIENLTGLQRGQLIEENRERNHLVILDALGQDKFDEYTRYENLIRAELKRIDVEVLRRDRGEEEFSLQLPAERFGASVDLGRLMEEAGVEVLGYVPLFSVFGSYTYMRTPDGSVDWDHVGDLDIRIHARKSLSFKQYLDFRTRLFEKLKAVQGLVVDSPGIDDPQRRGDAQLYWAIKDITTNHSIVLNTQMGNLDDVFAGTGSFMSYRVTDRFFGDVSEINALTKNLSVNDMLQTTVRFYLETIGELKMAISEPYTSTHVLGKLKTFYQLAVMRGKGEEYRWLIGEIDRFNDQIKRNAFDPVDFGKVTARALQGLDVSQDVFVPDLANVFRAGSFGAKAKDPLDIQIEVPVFVGIDAVSLIDEESRRSQYQSVRNAVIEKVKAAFASSQEDGFALGRSIERLVGASVDSIFDTLKKSSGDPVRLQALIREAKIALSYTLDPRWNTFILSLSNTGEGMSIEYLNALRRDYKELQKPGLIGVRTYEALYSMIGPAMADNRWNEIEVVTRVLGTPQAYRFTTGRGDQPSVNDYFWQSDHGTRVTINGRSSRQRPQFAIEADAGGAKNFKSPVDEGDAPFDGERLEMSLFDRGIDYVPYDESAPSERSEDRSKMLERLAARAQNAMIGSLVATDVPTVPEGKEYLLEMLEEFYYNGVDAVLEKLDSMEPSQRESAVGQAKLTYSYREDLQTNQFEIVLSDVGTGISSALLNDWKEERFGSTKPSRDEDQDEEFKGPYFGHTGFGMNVNLRDAEDLGYTVTIVTRTPDGVTRKFVQTPDGQRSVTQMVQGRADFGTDVIITGEMTGGSSAGKTSALPVQSKQDNALGGIDMNQNALNLKTEGQDIKFDMPFNPAQWENIKIEGFTPVILQINTTNLPLFIGANEPDKTIQLSSV